MNVLLLLATLSVAQFEGVLDYKVTSPGGGGTMKMYLSKDGMRTQMQMMGMKFTVLNLWSNKSVVYRLDEDQKTYTEMDVTKQQATAPSNEKYEVKKLGEETIAGMKASHGIVKDSKGTEMEIWVTKEIMPPAEVRRAFSQGPQSREGMYKALDDAGMVGMMVKMQSKKGDGLFELVKVEKKKVDASLFSLSGYTQSKGGGSGLDSLPPEVQKKIREQMEKAQREQRGE